MRHPLPVTKFLPGVHDIDRFDCGHDDISQWLKDRAHEKDWPDKTSVTVALDGDRVVAFYALLNSAIKYRTAPASLTSIQSDRYDIPATYLKVACRRQRVPGQGIWV